MNESQARLEILAVRPSVQHGPTSLGFAEGRVVALLAWWVPLAHVAIIVAEFVIIAALTQFGQRVQIGRASIENVGVILVALRAHTQRTESHQ